jgi:hypothetical protein
MLRRSGTYVVLVAGSLLGLFTLSCNLFRPNTDPIIVQFSGLTYVQVGGRARYWCAAVDDDGDSLTYAWTCSRGSFSGERETVDWTAPDEAGVDTIAVTVSDGRGGTASKSKLVNVTEQSSFGSARPVRRRLSAVSCFPRD